MKFYISFCFGYKNNQFLTENEFEFENFQHFSEKSLFFPYKNVKNGRRDPGISLRETGSSKCPGSRDHPGKGSRGTKHYFEYVAILATFYINDGYFGYFICKIPVLTIFHFKTKPPSCHSILTLAFRRSFLANDSI